MMKFVLFAFFFAVPFLAAFGVPSRSYNDQTLTTSVKNCDSKGLLRLCRCEETYEQILICSGLDSDRQLLSLLETIRSNDFKVRRFMLQNSTFEFLPSNAFNGLKIQSIHIASSTLSSLTDSDFAFVGLEQHLNSLHLEKTVLLSGWDWSALRNLSLMNGLYFYNANVDYLDKAPEGILKTLDEVMVQNSGVASLHPQVLRSIHGIRRALFEYNQIKGVKRTMFPTPALKLYGISFNHNEIEDLQEDMFTNMPALNYVYLNHNKMHTLNEKVFYPLKNLKLEVEIQGNYLECDCRLFWILQTSLQIDADCRNPLELRRKKVVDLKPKDLKCLS